MYLESFFTVQEDLFVLTTSDLDWTKTETHDLLTQLSRPDHFKVNFVNRSSAVLK